MKQQSENHNEEFPVRLLPSLQVLWQASYTAALHPFAISGPKAKSWSAGPSDSSSFLPWFWKLADVFAWKIACKTENIQKSFELVMQQNVQPRYNDNLYSWCENVLNVINLSYPSNLFEIYIQSNI